MRSSAFASFCGRTDAFGPYRYQSPACEGIRSYEWGLLDGPQVEFGRVVNSRILAETFSDKGRGWNML